jgi:phosphoglycerate dehydrogenase-like enzyme
MTRAVSAIIVHPSFDGIWPFAAEHWKKLWEKAGPVEFVRLRRTEGPVALKSAGSVRRLALLSADLDLTTLTTLPNLQEIGLAECELGDQVRAETERRLVRVHRPTSEGYWGQSVAEFALGLTLAALRRIPQMHRQILGDLSPWDYSPPATGPAHGQRGSQFGDDPLFANGTIAGKRVRIVGAGNIGSRFASFCGTIGADVAIWDPFASEPGFHRAGARREWHLPELVRDADIFAPMLPLTDSTRGLVTAALIDALPRGCLVVLVTRATICDMAAIRRRVTSGELGLAADVFDIEPLPLDDPLLGRNNVVHTPHNAGRTIHANEQLVENIAAQFLPIAM